MPRPPSALQSATSGAVGAMVALALTYPLSVVKTRLQAQRRHSAKENSSGVTEYKGMVHCIRSICREEGWVKLYAGFGPALFKSFVTNFVFYFFYGLFSPYFAANCSTKHVCQPIQNLYAQICRLVKFLVVKFSGL